MKKGRLKLPYFLYTAEVFALDRRSKRKFKAGKVSTFLCSVLYYAADRLYFIQQLFASVAPQYTSSQHPQKYWVLAEDSRTIQAVIAQSINFRPVSDSQNLHLFCSNQSANTCILGDRWMRSHIYPKPSRYYYDALYSFWNFNYYLSSHA